MPAKKKTTTTKRLGKKPGRAPMSSKAETEKRTNDVYLMLLQGYQRKHILQYTASNWNIATRTTDEYISKARQQMSEDQQIELETKKHEILSQLYNLYQKNLKIEDFRECRGILKEIADIFGVRAAKKIDHTTEGKPIIQEIDYTKLSTMALEEIERIGQQHQKERDEPKPI